jgi:hypothetical protein
MLTKTRLSFAFLVAAMFSTGTASAAPVAVNDYIKFTNGAGTTAGGEFGVEGTDIDSFITFCLQRTEYIDFSNSFHVDGITEYAYSDPIANGGDGAGKDFLSAQTAFLYTQFSLGSLTGYDYLNTGIGRATSANKLQNAIWMFEQELAMDANNYYVKLANKAIADGLWSGIGDVRVMNLSLRGVESQDQLVIIPPDRDITAVPEPASLFLFGSGLSAVAMARKRRAARAAEQKAA